MAMGMCFVFAAPLLANKNLVETRLFDSNVIKQSSLIAHCVRESWDSGERGRILCWKNDYITHSIHAWYIYLHLVDLLW